LTVEKTMKPIYLDNAASTPMSKKVIKEVSDANTEYYANPFSMHAQGQLALKALNNARKELAMELGVKSEEIIFTSGGTESNALALIGVAQRKKKEGKSKIIISSIEHTSVYENAKQLGQLGFTVCEIPISEDKGLDFNILEKELDNSVAIVSIMSVNSDTGIINDIARVAKICKSLGIILHVDHSQGFGKLALQPKTLGIDLLTADAHKLGGPKGIGLLYVRTGLEIEPLFKGGGKEQTLRPGTENVPGAMGFAAALKEQKKIDWKKVEKARDSLEIELEKIGGRITAKKLRRAATHIHVCFQKTQGEELANYLSTKEIYCSTGSACDSNKKEKRILENLGVPGQYVQGAIRFSLAQPITAGEVKRVAKEVKTFLNRFKNTQT
jgi:cysteine desulfurase